jgi:hypothetical protein
MLIKQPHLSVILTFLAVLPLSGCGGSSGGGSTASATSQVNYSISGTISGLMGSVVLQDNLGDNLSLSANGTFNFTTKVANGSPYSVTVLTQPAGQLCTVSTGAGTVSNSNITNVSVACSSNTYSLGGTISGLTGTVVLQNNGGDNLSISANGIFNFITKVANGSPYTVTVLTQPIGQSCSIAFGTGTFSTANVNNISVTCATNTHTIGGTVTGLNGSMMLQNNGSDNLIVSVNGGFSFPTTIAYANPYSVTVLTQPAGQLCTVSLGSGTVSVSNISDVSISCSTIYASGNIYTLAGLGTNGLSGDNGLAITARFNNPTGVAVDNAGNLYVADSGNNVIRKISSGIITTVAGNGSAGYSGDNGLATSAQLSNPTGIAIDSTGNIYIADNWNNVIRKVSSGIITTVAGNGTFGLSGNNGLATSAQLGNPYSVAIDGSGNIFIADTGNDLIRKVSSGIITTVAGGGATGYYGNYNAKCQSAFGCTSLSAISVALVSPKGIAVDSAGVMYIADTGYNFIFMVDSSGNITVVAGDGTWGYTPSPLLNNPTGIAIDSTNNLCIVDSGNNLIRKMTTGVISTIAGTGNQGFLGDNGVATSAWLFNPTSISFDGTGNMFIADAKNNRVRIMIK